MAKESPEFIAKCVGYAQAEKRANVVSYDLMCQQKKITTEQLTVHLLRRILNNQ